jgi:hypothetical protein
MNELIVALDTLLQDLDSAEGELRSAKYRKLDHPFTQRLESINSTLLYLKDLTSGLLEQLNYDSDRVYYIGTTTEVDTYVRVHAKNQRDAIQLACDLVERHIERGMPEFDVHTYTEGKQAIDYGHDKDKPVFSFPYAKPE